MKKTVRKFKETIEIRSSLLKRIRSHRYFTVLIFGGAILSISCLHVWQRVRVISLVQEVSLLEKENKSLKDYLRKEKSSIASLTLAGRIEKYACDTLGMRPVSAENIVTLMPEKNQPPPADDLGLMLSAIERVSEFVPIVSQSEAMADELQIIEIDSSSTEGGQ